MVLSHTEDAVSKTMILTSLNNPLPVTDSTFQIQLGNVTGFELLAVGGQNFNVGTTFTDLTPSGGNQTLPTSAETWEIVSTDANDASAGTGARTVFVASLDEDYVEQSTTVTLNGTTPVTLANTHLRSRNAIVITAGSGSSNTNIGDLIIQVSGGGTERMRLPSGIGDCKSLIFTVPAGKTALLQHFTLFTKKNKDFTLRLKVTPFGRATVTGGELSTYQTEQDFPIVAPFQLSEKGDILVEVKSDNQDTTALTFLDFLIVDNDKILNVLATGFRNII